MILAREDQTLEEHIERCLESFESIRCKKFWKMFGEKAEKDFRIAIVLHDSGKIFYQGKKSFLGHEIFSAFISHVFTREFPDLNSKLVEAIILYHHYAMGLKDRIKKFKIEFKDFKVCNKSEEFEEILEEHKSIALKYIDLEGSSVKKAMEKVNESIRKRLNGCRLEYGGTLEILKEENSEIWKRFVSEKDFRKLALFCINMMTVVDYAGALEKGKKTDFGRVVEEFIRIYAPLGRL
ncbi:MAG: HD domain-containing protein [Archaeoglobaceae archaeon]